MWMQRALACSVVTAGILAASVALAQKTPNPPVTGPFSIQKYMGGTKRVLLSVMLPTEYSDGTPIKEGTAIWIRVDRSLDGGKTFTTRVQLVSEAKGFAGQGKAGSRKKPWVDIVAETPVDNRPPYQVYLGATAVIRGKESALNTSNLSFTYYPTFVRLPGPPEFAPDEEIKGGLEGRWTLSPNAGTLLVTRDGSKFTAVISGRGQSLRFGGTVKGRVYSFTFALPFGAQTVRGSGTLTVSADRRFLDLNVTANGVSKPVRNRLIIEGRTITIPRS